MRQMTFRFAGIVLAAGAALAGCSTVTQDTGPQENFAVARGRTIAQVQCSGCHQIGPMGDSSNPMAPPFGVVRLRYNELSLPRRMAQVGDDGHYEMPGFNLPRTDIDDITAYIASFKGQ